MASSIALRRASLLKKLINGNSVCPVSAAAVTHSATVRSFNTNTQMTTFDNDDDRSVDVNRRSDRGVSRRRDSFPTLFSDVFDPLSAPRTVNQLLNMMDRFMEDPLLASRGGMGVGRGWNVKEDENAVYIRMDMPGVDKDNVKVSVEQNTLVIKAECEKESEEEEYGRRYSSRLDLPMNLYKVDEIKAEMKNGVLKVTVPRVKEDERKDVFQVKIE